MATEKKKEFFEKHVHKLFDSDEFSNEWKAFIPNRGDPESVWQWIENYVKEEREKVVEEIEDKNIDLWMNALNSPSDEELGRTIKLMMKSRSVKEVDNYGHEHRYLYLKIFET